MKQAILAQLTATKYYFIIVYATPDTSHVEQTSFILRYVHCKDKVTYEVQERFLEFVDCNQKTGKSIAELINETLRKYVIHVPLADCREQGYDNGFNLSGSYKGACPSPYHTEGSFGKVLPLCLPQSKLLRGFCCRMLS